MYVLKSVYGTCSRVAHAVCELIWFRNPILVFILFCRRHREESRKRFAPFLYEWNVIWSYSIPEIISKIPCTFLGSCITSEREVCSIFQTWRLSFPCTFHACNIIAYSKTLLPVLSAIAHIQLFRVFRVPALATENWSCVTECLPVPVSRTKRNKNWFHC